MLKGPSKIAPPYVLRNIILPHDLQCCLIEFVAHGRYWIARATTKLDGHQNKAAPNNQDFRVLHTHICCCCITTVKKNIVHYSVAQCCLPADSLNGSWTEQRKEGKIDPSQLSQFSSTLISAFHSKYELYLVCGMYCLFNVPWFWTCEVAYFEDATFKTKVEDVIFLNPIKFGFLIPGKMKTREMERLRRCCCSPSFPFNPRVCTHATCNG